MGTSNICYRCGIEDCTRDDCPIDRAMLLEILKKLPPVTDEQIRIYKQTVGYWAALSERERLEAWSAYVRIRAG